MENVENALELNSPDEVLKVFTDKIHCTLTMDELVTTTMKVADNPKHRALKIIVPSNLVISIFNALLIAGKGKFDGIEFEYDENDNKEYEIWIERNAILYNPIYENEKEYNCVLAVSSMLHDNHYLELEYEFILFHSKCSKELFDMCTRADNGNHVIRFDIKD